jgi:hypothetical protein
MAQAAVRRVNEIRREKSLPYSELARSVGIPESTLRRWRSHEKRHLTILTVPGPKKTLLVDMDALMRGMETLRPGRCRTAGAPDLWQIHRDRISRRDFYSVLTRYSARILDMERQGWYRYRWLKVGAVWSMDDMDFGHDEFGRRLRIHNVMDLGSRNMFQPVDSDSLPAEKVADNLEGLFREHGAPIFAKSDCGSNLLRSEPVSALLTKWCVVPLLSPPYYPQYNGVMERGQSDTRMALMDLLPKNACCDAVHFGTYAAVATDKRNHDRREILGGHHACHVFSTRNGEMKTDIRERRTIYDWIKTKQESILSSSVNNRDGWAVNAAWRSAAEEWLLQNKVIKIIPRTEKVSTDFSEMSAHN